jgi:septal ring factor EnvC (AmiA/AmiB activator)
VDVTEITRPRWRLIQKARASLADRPTAPSARAHAVLVLSAFLLGAVLSALVFVGVWRHTAAAGDRAEAAHAAVQRELSATRGQLATVERKLGREHSLLARIRADRATAVRELARLRHADTVVATQLPGHLQSIDSSAAALSHSMSALESELSALNGYLASARTRGIDAGYVAAQIRYLMTAAQRTLANVRELSSEAQAAASVAATLSAGK